MDVLLRFADLIGAHAAEFALLDSVEMGKTVSGMLGFDVPSAVANIRFAAEAIDKIEGAVTNTDPGALHYVLRQPLGVVGLIVPWNYPMLMACWKLGPALAMGNSVVLKPAQQTGMSAVLLARLFAEAGGPAGCSASSMARVRMPGRRWPGTWTWTRSALPDRCRSAG